MTMAARQPVWRAMIHLSPIYGMDTRAEIEAKLRQAEADLEAAREADARAAYELACAITSYREEYGKPFPFRYSKDDPTMTKVVAARAAIKRADDARTSALDRIEAAKRALSGVVGE